mmetsp:Transcript_2541/g.306  ORF Transcript_2541/g.306 Transcript_2541/m.306 type:complete len:108 (+) Transcript_2541:664-987(+)
MVLEAVCIILKVPPIRYKKSGEYIQDYWMAATGKKVLGDPKILERLIRYKRSSLPKTLMTKLEKFIQNEDFNPEMAKRASEAARGLCMWVIALVSFHKVLREIRPKE